MKIILRCIIAVVLATMTSATFADPPIWDAVFGTDTLPVGDNASENRNLGFNFPFEGNTYNSIKINTNGGVALGNGGMYDAFNLGQIDFDIWEDAAFEPDFTTVGEPLILVFATDLDYDIGKTGTIYFKTDNTTRAVITWSGMGTNQVPGSALITFQLTLESNGKITFGYDFDQPMSDLIASLDQGIVVGVSNGTTVVPPGSIDLSTAGTGGTGIAGGDVPTAYEIWCYTDGNGATMEPDCQEPGQTQDTFDLDDMNIIFKPNCGTGLAISNDDNFIFRCFGGTGGSGGCSLGGTGRPAPLLWLLAVIASVGIVWRRRKNKYLQAG